MLKIIRYLILFSMMSSITFAQFSKFSDNPFSNTILLSLGGGISHSETDYTEFDFSLNGYASAEYFFKTESELFFGAKLETGFANLKAHFSTPTRIPDLDINVLSIGPAVSFNYLFNKRLIPYISFGSKYNWYHDFTSISLSTEIGLKYLISDYFSINGNVVLNFYPEDNLDKLVVKNSGNDFYSTFSIGLSYAVDLSVSTDIDGDGIENDNDLCPEQAEDFDGFEDNDGCPEYDNDSDGIVDLKDKCVNNAEDFDGFEDNDGCPDKDNDQDGIADVDDECPDLKEDFDGFEDGDGCPELDNDNDGLVDLNDDCPNEAEIFNSYEDFDGCPDELPVNNILEEPTKIEEQPNKTKKKEKIRRVAIPNEFMLEGDILFEPNKTEIKSSATRKLDEIADMMLSNPDFKWRIEGHLDNSGTRQQLKALSSEWANSVMNYFVSKGLSPKSFQVIGMADALPLAPNSSLHGKLKNRRIVIKRVR